MGIVNFEKLDNPRYVIIDDGHAIVCLDYESTKEFFLNNTSLGAFILPIEQIEIRSIDELEKYDRDIKYKEFNSFLAKRNINHES